MIETSDLESMEAPELRKMLKALKNKETKLEADLAIKEHPELEDTITPIVLALNNLKICSKKLSQVSDPAWNKKVKTCEQQLVFFRKRVSDLEAELSDLLESSEAPALIAKRDEAAGELKNILEKCENDFSLAGIKADDLIPSLEDYV